MSTLFTIWNTIQYKLFPWLEEELDPLTEKEQKFIQVVSLLDLENHLKEYKWRGMGRKKKDRMCMTKAFIAKSVYNFETTDILIEYLKGCKNLRRLCGWEHTGQVPSKSTFSRSFTEFSNGQLAQKIHEAMVIKHCGSKLAGHVSRDSTSIESREKPAKRNSEGIDVKLKSKRGRPRKDEIVPPKPPRRLDLQANRRLEDNLNELPNQCDVGTKQNSKGYTFELVTSFIWTV